MLFLRVSCQRTEHDFRYHTYVRKYARTAFFLTCMYHVPAAIAVTYIVICHAFHVYRQKKKNAHTHDGTFHSDRIIHNHHIIY